MRGRAWSIVASVGAFAGLMAVLLLLPGSGAGAAAGDDDITVRSLTRDGRILVSFRLNSAFTDDLREAIRSGLPASITYDVFLRRGTALWFDRTLARATVTAGVRYDNLTRQHQLSRTIDGRGEEPRMTEDEEVVRAWLTDFKLLPLFTTGSLEPNAEYYVKVGARTRPRVNRFLFWPWEQEAATGYHRFTFVQ
jgi:hypothetical protein